MNANPRRQPKPPAREKEVIDIDLSMIFLALSPLTTPLIHANMHIIVYKPFGFYATRE